MTIVEGPDDVSVLNSDSGALAAPSQQVVLHPDMPLPAAPSDDVRECQRPPGLLSKAEAGRVL
eukprot:1729590-Pyramimonas_sp.AAC.1